MRWLDIDLPRPGTDRNLDRALDRARAYFRDLTATQERDGLDAVTVTRLMREVGRQLFQAVTVRDVAAFDPQRDAAVVEPALQDPEHDALTGYHLVVPEAWQDLPWSWLHNGIDHLLVKHPLCWSGHGAALDADPPRPWMQRRVRAGFLVGDGGTSTLRSIVGQLRETGVARPELLFVAGHSEESVRRLIHREADAVTASLAGGPMGDQLAGFEVPADAITPGRLREQALAFQAIHYAGATSMAAAAADAGHDRWLDLLVEDALSLADADLDAGLGLDAATVGVDPVTAMLDEVSERVARGGAADSLFRRRDGAPGDGRGWLLDDGPATAEGFARGGGLPPLVFSNSHRALPHLGTGFLRAGASTVIGPVAPLFSRPARRFAGHVYRALGDGWCAGASVWRAASILLAEVGRDHPAWLSYGALGYGTLALQYL